MTPQTKIEICHLVNQMPLSGIQKFNVKESISKVLGEDIVIKAPEHKPSAGDLYERTLNGEKLLYMVVHDFTLEEFGWKLVLVHNSNLSPGMTNFRMSDLMNLKFKYVGKADFSGWLLED